MVDIGSKRDLQGIPVAILATDGFEDSELVEPLEALRLAGADVKVISLPETSRAIRGKSGTDARVVGVDGTVDAVTPEGFAALVLPGGKANAARLCESADAVSFVRGFFADGKPVAAICHGPWLVLEAGAAWGKTLTSYPAIRCDLEAAGAIWVDEDVVVEHNLVTSRTPADLDAFIDAMLERIQSAVQIPEPSS